MGRNKALNAYFGSHFCEHKRTESFSEVEGGLLETGTRCADPNCHAVISSYTRPVDQDEE